MDFVLKRALTYSSSILSPLNIARMAESMSDHQVFAHDISVGSLFQNDPSNNTNVLPDDGVYNNEGQASTTSLLLSAPLEIRHHIYGHFLKCDEIRYLPESKFLYPFDFKILSVCQQIRSEAWEYFCSSNRWIQHVIYHERRLLVPHQARNPSLFEVPLNLFPEHEMAALNSHITLTIRAGKDFKRRKPSDRCVFAYNKPDWVQRCMDLSLNSHLYSNMSFNLTAGLHGDFMPLLQDFLAYLPLIYNVREVQFVQMMEKDLLQNMAANMTNAVNLPAEALQQFFVGLLEEGNLHQAQGDLNFANIFYGFGFKIAQKIKDAALESLLGWGEDHLIFKDPKMMAALHLGTDLELAYCAALQELMEREKVDGSFPPHVISELKNNRSAVRLATEWPGFTKEQRLREHHIRGTIELQMAEYLADSVNASYAFEVRKRDSRGSDSFYRYAAYHFFHAAEIDPIAGQPSKLLGLKISNLLGEACKDLKPELVSIHIPGYGIWKGDVDSFELTELTIDEHALFHNKEFCIKENSELTKLKEKSGIRWRGEPAGMLRLLVM